MMEFLSSSIASSRGREHEGQALVDYSMILLCVVIACVLAVAAFGASVLGLYESVLAAWP